LVSFDGFNLEQNKEKIKLNDKNKNSAFGAAFG
jgi:hypothetical protein